MISNSSKKVLAFGELMLRHSVNDINDVTELENANRDLFEDSYGGSEANVLIALQELGVNTRYFTAFPNNINGERAIEFLKTCNIDTSEVLLIGDEIGEYYVVTKCTNRALATKYNRDNAAVTHIDPKNIDFDKLFDGVELFHFSGVDLALKGNTRDVCRALVYEARKRKIKVSFDFNYRENLWKKDNTSAGIEQGKAEAKAVFQEIVPNCSYVFAAHIDLSSWFDFDGDAKEFLNQYPNIECIVLRDKKQLSLDTKEVTAEIYTKNESFVFSSPRKFNVKENIGGGDAFDAGIIYGLLNHDYNLEKALKFGIECYILKHQIKGDVLKGIDKKQIENNINS